MKTVLKIKNFIWAKVDDKLEQIFNKAPSQGRSQTFQNEGASRGAQGWAGGGADWDSKWRLSIDLCTKCNFIWGRGGQSFCRGQSPPCPPPPPLRHCTLRAKRANKIFFFNLFYFVSFCFVFSFHVLQIPYEGNKMCSIVGNCPGFRFALELLL